MRRRCASDVGISVKRERIFCLLVHFVGVGIFITTDRCAIHDGVVVVVRTWRRRKRQGLFREIWRAPTS
jgi:hypothetical protein